jgi:type II secretory pathway pseudopilin PulG
MAENTQTPKTNSANMGIELLGHGLDWWNSALLVALAIAAFAAFAVAAATRGVIIVQKREARASEERIAAAELKTEQLRKELGPRHLQREIFVREIAESQGAPVKIMYLIDDPECFDLAQQIWRALEDAHWPVQSPKPIPPLLLSDSPTSVSVGGQPSGVTVVARTVSEDEANAAQNRFAGKPWVRTPWTVLMHVLGDALGKVSGHGGGTNVPSDGTLRVVVAPR